MSAFLFRKVGPEGLKKIQAFLTADVEATGGSAGEMVSTPWGDYIHLRVCKVPWGTLLIRNVYDNRLEALVALWAWFDEPDI